MSRDDCARRGRESVCATCEARVPEGEGTYDPLTGGVVCDECREKYCDD